MSTQRWPDPTLPTLLPDDFVNLAAFAGLTKKLISQITRIMLSFRPGTTGWITLTGIYGSTRGLA